MKQKNTKNKIKRNLGKNEKDHAKKIWSNYRITKFYYKEHEWVPELFNPIIAKYNPQSVLEFGCMVGRNLNYIRKQKSAVKCVGIDINKRAIIEGKKAFGLDLRYGDESYLKKIKDNSFDLVFTLSVLDHIPFIDLVCAELVRCAKKCLFCIEISMDKEGKMVNNPVKATYSWHVEKHVPMNNIKDYSIKDVRLSKVGSGNYYKAYDFEIK